MNQRSKEQDLLEAALNERTISLEKSERESNLVQIRQIAAQRLARIHVLEESVHELKSQRVTAGNERAQAISDLNKVKLALPILRVV